MIDLFEEIREDRRRDREGKEEEQNKREQARRQEERRRAATDANFAAQVKEAAGVINAVLDEFARACFGEDEYFFYPLSQHGALARAIVSGEDVGYFIEISADENGYTFQFHIGRKKHVDFVEYGLECTDDMLPRNASKQDFEAALVRSYKEHREDPLR
jgi:hypothetical protein